MTRKLFHPFMLLYVGTVLILNLGFSYVPMIETAIGFLSPMAVIAGVVFVVRDFAQREVGHYVLIAMLVAALLTFGLADPFVAIASVTAFAFSEIMDWALYTVTKKPFHQRVLISSLISTPIDTAVFLYLINGMTAGTFALMIGAKMLAALYIWYAYRAPTRNEQYI
jgi:queuosine precursor transporter